ncbi:hypothetical protein FB45DRAFT_922368 [Roridomyces roridus]|uniref:Uncharacterized protein n=1 Tax=Roridomyces roridus TaxID=1738132 RepID=A0AAD7BNS2_9AGAR|nr:hypothetical protein FB45DRAFT_922368 [Roridomyces roridus]
MQHIRPPHRDMSPPLLAAPRRRSPGPGTPLPRRRRRPCSPSPTLPVLALHACPRSLRPSQPNTNVPMPTSPSKPSTPSSRGRRQEAVVKRPIRARLARAYVKSTPSRASLTAWSHLPIEPSRLLRPGYHACASQAHARLRVPRIPSATPTLKV